MSNHRGFNQLWRFKILILLLFEEMDVGVN